MYINNECYDLVETKGAKMTAIYDFLILFVGSPVGYMQELMIYNLSLIITFVLFLAMIELFFSIAKVFQGG